MLKVNKLTKLEERICYDSWWLVETNQGIKRLHQFDGVNKDKLKENIEKLNSLDEFYKLVPTFYFD
jgi:hypothetical protein